MIYMHDTAFDLCGCDTIFTFISMTLHCQDEKADEPAAASRQRPCRCRHGCTGRLMLACMNLCDASRDRRSLTASPRESKLLLACLSTLGVYNYNKPLLVVS